MVDYMSSSGREYSAISGTNSQMFTEVTQDTASPYTHTGSNGTELVLETQNDEVSTEESQYETTVNDPDLTRSESPDTELISERSDKPDISIICDICKQYVDMRALSEHRTYHKSLSVLYYKDDQRPADVEALIKRRRALLKRLKAKCTPENPIDTAVITKINDAYEFLKSYLEDTFDVYRQIRENINIDVSGLALNCSTVCAPAVGICSTQNNRWKNVMEDTRVFQDCFGHDVNKCFFGVYDGHNGHFASETAASELHKALLHEMEKFDPRTKCTHGVNQANNEVDDCDIRPATRDTERGLLYGESTNMIQEIIENCKEKLEDMEKAENSRSQSSKKRKTKDVFCERMNRAMRRAHYITDLLLTYGKDERSKVRWSGCSTFTCVLQNKQTKDDAVSGEVTLEVPDLENKCDLEKDGEKELKELGMLHIAHAGNVQAVLVRGNKAYKLNRDHTPNNPKEKIRVTKAGGTVSDSNRELRVNGILATTRGLGNHGDPALKKCVISEPYTTSVPIDQYAQLLVIASNGVWEVFSEEQVASLLIETFPSNHIPPPSRLSTSINLLLAEFNSRQHVKASVEWNRRRPWRLHSAASELTSEGEQTEGSRSVKTGRVRIMNEDGTVDDTQDKGDKGSVSSHLSTDGNTDKKVQDRGDFLNPENIQKRSTKKTLSPLEDMQTEAGSHFGNFSDEDSGNEADIDTNTDILSMRSGERHVTTKEGVQRECAKLLSERLVQAALLAGARDNITVMVVLLPGCGL